MHQIFELITQDIFNCQSIEDLMKHLSHLIIIMAILANKSDEDTKSLMRLLEIAREKAASLTRV